jgi:hypothetical protein
MMFRSKAIESILWHFLKLEYLGMTNTIEVFNLERVQYLKKTHYVICFDTI